MWILYVTLPLVYRFVSSAEKCTVLNVIASLAPILVNFLYLYRLSCMNTTYETEHVIRHVIFLVAYIAGVGNINFEYLFLHRMEPYAQHFIVFVIVAGVTLAYFCIAHVLENNGLKSLATHHGDIVVLPLTFVA